MKVFAVRTLVAVPFFVSPKVDYMLAASFFRALLFIGIKASHSFLSKTEVIGYVTELSGGGRFFFYAEGRDAYVTNTSKRSDVFL